MNEEKIFEVDKLFIGMLLFRLSIFLVESFLIKMSEI